MFRLILLLLTFVIVSSSYAKEDDFLFTMHPDRFFSVTAKSVPLKRIVDKVGLSVGIKVFIDPRLSDKKVTVDLKRVMLVELLQRVAGENYVLVYAANGKDVVGLHVFPMGKTPPGGPLGGSSPRVFFSPKDRTPKGIKEYIEERHAVLKRLAEESPNKKIDAHISFEKLMTPRKLVAWVNEQKLKIVDMRFKWNEHTGGGGIVQGVPLERVMEEALEENKSIVEDGRAELSLYLEEYRKFGLKDNSSEVQEVFRSSRSLDSLDLAVKKYGGIPYQSVQVESHKAKDLYAMTKDKEVVRLVDPLYFDAIGAVNGLLTNEPRKIAIPLDPETTEVVDIKQGEGK